jgi:mannitol/fructose-specific phosphotransferase system IIA component (Ntr-type)
VVVAEEELLEVNITHHHPTVVLRPALNQAAVAMKLISINKVFQAHHCPVVVVVIVLAVSSNNHHQQQLMQLMLKVSFKIPTQKLFVDQLLEVNKHLLNGW